MIRLELELSVPNSGTDQVMAVHKMLDSLTLYPGTTVHRLTIEEMDA